MSALPSNAVHTGLWVDHSKSSVLGATFTTRSGTGNVLIALLSILIGFAGSHLWDLLSFSIYLCRSTNQPVNALHHQHQLLLRNAASPGAYALESIKAIWYWRPKLHNSWKQFIAPVFTALLCSWGFLVAGVFASQVVLTSDIMVLASSDRCAYLASQTGDAHYETSDKVNQLWSQNSAMHVSNALYAQSCYDTSEKLSQCNIYPVQDLAATSRTVPCPFGDLCYGTDGTALMLESSLIDSHKDLGINSRPENRVQWQQRLTCAPLDSDRFMTIVNATEESPMLHMDHVALPDEVAYHYNLGPSLTAYRQGNVSWRLDNYTASLGTAYTDGILTHDPTNLALNNWNSTIPALNKSDVTMTLIYIASNAMRNFFPTEDPVFAAHRPTDMEWNGQNSTVYLADKPMGIIACQEEHRFCLSKNGCTPYSSRNRASRAAPLLANPVQNATLRWVYKSIPGLNVFSSGSNIPELRATATVESGVQWAPLPPNQWEVEMKRLWPLRAAWVQAMPLLTALGASTLQGDSYEQPLTPITNPLERTLCSTIKMQAPQGYVNINVFGLAFVIGVCGLTILINLVLTPAFKFAARTRDTPRIRRWIQDGMLHVLRKAYEGVDCGSWEQTWCDVPCLHDATRQMVTLADSQNNTSYTFKADASFGHDATTLASDRVSRRTLSLPGKSLHEDIEGSAESDKNNIQSLPDKEEKEEEKEQEKEEKGTLVSTSTPA